MIADWTSSLSGMRRVIDSRRADDEAGIHARLGETLLDIQRLESSLRMVMTFVLQKADQPLTLEKLQAQQAAERAKTIGYFLAQMRRRVAVAPELDATLTSFLAMRNTFSHNLSDIEGWDLKTAAGLAIANDFVSDLRSQAVWLYFWLAGLMRDWSEQVGIRTAFDDEPVMEFIDRTFRPLAVWSLDELPE